MNEEEFMANDEIMPKEPCEYEKTSNENVAMNYLKRKVNKIFKKKKDKKDEETENENNEKENIESMKKQYSELSEDTKEKNMYKEFLKEEKDKRYEIKILIGKYYDEHIQELEKSINKKDELINKIYEITKRY